METDYSPSSTFAATLQLLANSLPSVDMQDVLRMESPSATFEYHEPMELGADYYVYSINGNSLMGHLIVVRARTAGEAEDMAQSGLSSTITAMHKQDDLGVSIDAQSYVNGEEHKIGDVSGEFLEKLDRALNDRRN